MRLNRSLILVILAVTLLVTLAPPAPAQEWDFGDDDETEPVNPDPGGGGTGCVRSCRFLDSSNPTPSPYLPPGELCFVIYPGGPYNYLTAENAGNEYYGVPPCPGPDDPVLDSRRRWIEELRPETTTAAIAQAEGLTGKQVYLELEGPRRVRGTYESTATGHLFIVEGAPTYRIDWGDGETTETTDQGVAYGEWPGQGNAAITHVYRDQRTYDITVGTRWEGTLEVPDIGTTVDLEVIEMETVIEDFPIREVQAIRQR